MPFDRAVGELFQDLLGRAFRYDAATGATEADEAAALFANLAGMEYLAQKDVRGDMDAFAQKVRDFEISRIRPHCSDVASGPRPRPPSGRRDAPDRPRRRG